MGNMVQAYPFHQAYLDLSSFACVDGLLEKMRPSVRVSWRVRGWLC